MRIALVATNRQDMPEVVVPLGVMYVAANVPQGHEVCLWDLRFERDPGTALRNRIRAFEPDLVGMGLRNVTTDDYGGGGALVEQAHRLVQTARTATSAPIVLGGGGFSVVPSELMRLLRPDYGIVGEGERAFARLVRTLEGVEGTGRPAPEELDAIAGLWRWSGSRLVAGRVTGRFAELDALEPPARRLLDPRYLRQTLCDSVQTKRGCAFRCDYCTYPLVEGRSVRLRDPAAVAEEMCDAVRIHPEVASFFIVDAVFNRPAEHAKRVCHELIRRGWRLPWVCYVNPVGFDRELAELMRRAGCAGIEVGSDSGCDEVLRALRKGFTTEDVRQLRSVCRAVGLPDCHTFVLGTRQEGLEQARRTLDFVDELAPFAAIFMLWTDAKEAVSPERVSRAGEVRARIARMLRARRQPHHPWIAPGLGINYRPRLLRRLRDRGLTGPLWRHIYELGGAVRAG